MHGHKAFLVGNVPAGARPTAAPSSHAPQVSFVLRAVAHAKPTKRAPTPRQPHASRGACESARTTASCAAAPGGSRSRCGRSAPRRSLPIAASAKAA